MKDQYQTTSHRFLMKYDDAKWRQLILNTNKKPCKLQFLLNLNERLRGVHLNPTTEGPPGLRTVDQQTCSQTYKST